MDKTVLLTPMFAGLFLILMIIFAISSKRQNRKKINSNNTNSKSTDQPQTTDNSEIVINSIADGVIAIDKTGVIQLINPAAENIIGWENHDAVGLDYLLVMKFIDDKNEPISANLNPIQKVLREGGPFSSDEFIIVTKASRKINISLSVSPVGSFNSGAIIVFRDISAEIEKNREQTEFISTASHEMRTPVAAIEGYLGLALNPNTATIDDRARGYIEKAHESSEHLGRLFQDLLDISKAEDGRLNNRPVVIDLINFVRQSTSMLESKANEKQLKLSFLPDIKKEGGSSTLSPVFYTKVDADHLREVTLNLIENAIKYTREGFVNVDIFGDDRNVKISVQDSGIGIAKEDQAHLFQKFYRIDNTDTREIGGTGLGLYLCRRLVESMGGQIWVESDHGKGSTFVVQLARLSNNELSNEKF